MFFFSLRAVQFKCNTSAKSVTPVQITKEISEFSPKKPGKPQRLSKVTRGIPKISEDHRKNVKDVIISM